LAVGRNGSENRSRQCIGSVDVLMVSFKKQCLRKTDFRMQGIGGDFIKASKSHRSPQISW
jgi:hypothetical protein